MRNITAIAIILLLSAAVYAKPLGQGTYVDRDGAPHPWHVNTAGTLIWDHEPYLPAGAMYLSKFLMDFKVGSVESNEAAFRDDIQRLTAMKEAGITDLYLNPCVGWDAKPVWVWQRVADLFEGMGLCYGIQVTDELPRLRYFDISDEHTVTIDPGQTASVELANTLLSTIAADHRVYYAAFHARTGELVDWGEAKLTDTPTGVRAEARPQQGVNGVLVVHFIAENTYIGGAAEYWTYVNDEYRARLHRFFSALHPGPNFRLWIDPLDNEQSFQDSDGRRLPNSPAFRSMFADYLKRKYPTVSALAEAWGMMGSPDILDYATFARLLPLDPHHLLDETTGRTYRTDPSRSSMRADMMDFRDTSVGEFNTQVADLIKSHRDAPVVLKHEGSALYTNTHPSGGFDGLGAEAYGADVAHLRECSAAVHAQSLECAHTMWELTTETGFATPDLGYPTPLRMISDYAAMLEEGGKGTYAFLIKDAPHSPNADWYTFNLMEDPRQLYWLGAYARIVKSAPKLPDYLPGSVLPDRFTEDVLGMDVLDLGPAFQGIRFGSSTYIWNLTPAKLSLDVGPTRILVPANAQRPAVIEGQTEARIGGIDEANMQAAKLEWTTARDRLANAGIQADPISPQATWREVLAQAEKLRRSAGDAFAVPMPTVNIDGDLSEWKSVQPIYVKNAADVTDSRYDAARFYVGYDDDYLYVACSVEDDQVTNHYSLGKLWNGDAMEVFVDLHPDSSPGVSAYNSDCFQFIFAPTSANGAAAMTVISPGLLPDSVPAHSLWEVKKTPSGWRGEAAISRSDLKDYRFEPGKPIGFNIQLDQADDTDRVQMRIWRGGLDVFSNRLGFGRLSFAN